MKEYTKAKELIESLKTIPDYRVDVGKIKYPFEKVLYQNPFQNLHISDYWILIACNISCYNNTSERHKSIIEYYKNIVKRKRMLAHPRAKTTVEREEIKENKEGLSLRTSKEINALVSTIMKLRKRYTIWEETYPKFCV